MQTQTAFIPLARPDINEDDIALVGEVLRSGMLVQGEYVKKLEDGFAEYLGAKHAVAVSNGTASLHLALQCLHIGAGDEVIVPALSYPATANVVELVGAACVFVDVDERTFNIDVSKIEQAITDKTKAIIPVHEFGLCCDIETVRSIADKHRLYVIEDAACALGAEQHSKKAGTFGTIASFSLHPRKSITSGEGGVLVTDDDQIATKLRQLRNHGIEIIDGQMKFVEAGFNYRMTEFQAALAWNQFKRLDNILLYKDEIASIYLSEISNKKIQLPVVPKDRNHTWQTFHVLVDGLSQADAIQQLKTQQIGTNYGAQCIPAQPYYQQKYRLDAKALFPNAYRAFTCGLAIPVYERLTKDDAYFIAETLNKL